MFPNYTVLFLNFRLVEYCELLYLFVDEQNVFKQKGSCEDHIFALTSIINKQLYANKTCILHLLIWINVLIQLIGIY